MFVDISVPRKVHADCFALTQAEATSLVSDTIGQGGWKGGIEPKMLSAEIKDYITLVEELFQGDYYSFFIR